MKRNTSPLLHSVRVAAPCQESWDTMTGSERVRSCERCQHKVYNLSELTTSEAEALLRDASGRLCVRFYRRADGTILTKDCPVGATTRRNQRLAQAGAGIAAAVGAAAALFPSQPQPEPVMGKVAVYELGELAVSHPKTLDTNP